MEPTGDRPTNRLARETSPYLLQHAHDPVDWYPWGDEASEAARVRDVPIFLSIGYAACHWCHVMHRESFADATTASELNGSFVSIKVDREERPAVDALYMDALQALTGAGGWPMSVFLTPDGRPFHAGTYLPDTPRHGTPSFRQVLRAVSEAWLERREEVEAGATRLAAAVARGQGLPGGTAAAVDVVVDEGPDEVTALAAATAALEATFQPRLAAWSGPPLFPQPMLIEHLLREHLRTGARRPLDIAVQVLDTMARSGMRDQLGGGFARYATDARWLVPHFEQMLTDNAQLALAYLHASQVTGDDRHAAVARATLDFLASRMLVRDEGGGVVGFAASLDADTEGEEGRTYVWRLDEVRAVLGDDAALFEAAYGVTADGNWEGVTVLERVLDDASLAARVGMAPADVADRLTEARARLLAVRDRRPQPARDDKVIASWNGLALLALAEAAGALPDGAHDRDLAIEVARSLRDRLRQPDGRLVRSWKDGRAGPPAVLEDHTHLAAGLLALYEATFDETWYAWARELMLVVLSRFADPAGGCHDTADDATDLFARPRSLTDGALPSGNAMAVQVMARLYAFDGDARWVAATRRIRDRMAPLAAQHPTAFGAWLGALSLWAVPTDEVAVVGPMGDLADAPLVRTARTGWRPWQVVAATRDPAHSILPLLRDRETIDGLATAYVCHGGACRLPTTDPTVLAAQLRSVPTGGATS
ncbi:MAG: thioredoxin domain-containing protein [Chloroflexi bacterium]|nr:thioredoxin domain-containing protein [Chloroflexota bacterium]